MDRDLAKITLKPPKFIARLVKRIAIENELVSRLLYGFDLPQPAPGLAASGSIAGILPVCLFDEEKASGANLEDDRMQVDSAARDNRQSRGKYRAAGTCLQNLAINFVFLCKSLT